MSFSSYPKSCKPVSRFVSVDPLGAGVADAKYREYNLREFNLYSYAGSNPIKFVDPNGSEIEIVVEEDRWIYPEMELSTGKEEYLEKKLEEAKQKWQGYDLRLFQDSIP